MSQPHFSVSSSVYSPVESQRQSTFPNDPVIEEEEEEVIDQSSELFGSDYNDQSSQGSYSSQTRENNAILHDTSSNTFRSYYTANGSEPSFSSINNSLLKQDSNDNTAEAMPSHIDPDETPRLNTEMHGTNDSIFDKTPVMNSNGLFEPHNENSTKTTSKSSVSSSQLPQKFKRLSVTLLQTGSNVSRESHIFHTNFSSNAQKAHAQNQQNEQRTSRTSLLYRKIHEKHDSVPTPVTPYEEDSSMISTSSKLSNAPMRPDVSVDLNQIDVPPRGDLQAGAPKPPGGLNIVYGEGENSHPNDSGVDVSSDRIDPSRWSVASSTTEDEDMSSLFIRALHSFDATQSQLESENSVCLSFEKNDIAFVHTIDDSGWGEVILIETLERGWVPMNYFAMAITPRDTTQNEEVDSDNLKFSHFMFPLLNACGRFLSNPLSRDGPTGKTFSNKHLNEIKDGVRCLLDETDCLSRSSEIIVKKPAVRKARKAFMYDWWELMKKAAEYRGTSNFEKIEILTLFVLSVIRRGLYFFDVWLTESKDIIQKEAEKRLRTDINTYPLLRTPPLAKSRVTEIKGILYSYLSLIMGRLDLIEHNPQGCELLEKISCHILLLLSELLFISKTGLEYTSSKSAELDASMDAFMSFGDQLVTCVKVLINKTVGADQESRTFSGESSQNQDYTFTAEGIRLRQVAARTIKAINTSVRSINDLFDNIGDFKLGADRSYPDYLKMRIDPADFIRQCSVGMVQSHSLKNKDLRVMKKKNGRSTNRYSMFRSGKPGGLGMTPNGVNSLHKVMLLETDDTPFDSTTAEFQPFISKDSPKNNKAYSIKDELLVDANGTLLGASFKGLIYTLTNEDSPPQYFFISGFFICLRSFASGIDLLEGLISRFEESEGEVDNSDALIEVRLKKRRRLITAIFKIWMESFWNYDSDSPLLCTLINFFNEGIYPHLPLDAMKLIELAAKLSIKDSKGKDKKQLVERHVTLKKFERKDSGADLRDLEDTSRYSIMEDNELSRISSSSSITSSLKSMTLGLSLPGSNPSSGTLLTKAQQLTVETTVLKFRQVLGNAWCPPLFVESSAFHTIPLRSMLPTWFNLCEEKWELDQYRPNLLDFQVLEFSNQLTLIESEIFCSIKSSELLNENYTAKKAHLKLANNVRQSLLFTNCLSGYVLESILQPGLTDKQRVNHVKQWLKVGFSCFEMRNFNSMVAIITSLQSHLITRVKRIWEELPPKYTHLYEYLCNVAHPQHNFNVYREKLRFFLENSDYNYPVVPYFSLFLQDLTFVTDGNPNYRKANTFLNQKLINIDKHLKLTRVIADIESLQVRYVEEDGSRRRSRFSLNLGKNTTTELKIVSNPALQELVLLEFFKIAQLNKGEEDRAWKLSCELQPRDTPRVH